MKLIIVNTLLFILTYLAFTSCKNNYNSNSEPLSDFAVKDTLNIKKFTISDTEDNTITLSRDYEDNVWRIEGSNYKANSNSIKLIMETFYRILVKQDVPKNGVEHVLSSLAVRHNKVEIFMNGEIEPSKTWYIGSATKDHLGTYMLLQNLIHPQFHFNQEVEKLIYLYFQGTNL